ncbi:putative nonribosomal peptide synthase GliP-like protein [Periconia macrospinosa]|uniref:Putative nonribosomal peptide synthase GliP-like protein n=1 Tax=Periconia macrospinosa TaxID=97972 RepID=A0A2V1DZ86_9PLEO|nr:putative nonribosomal peptide synthase GliP-like protein [Periconia macrospinosa]
MESIILSQLSKELNLPTTEISPQSTFNSIGGDSITALRISDSCKRLGVLISISSIFTSQDIAELLRSGTWAVDQIVPGPHENGNFDHASRDTGASRLLQVGTDRSSGFRLSHASDFDNTNEIVPSRQKSERHDARKATRMMSLQSFLVSDTLAHPGNNIISYFQEHPPARVPALREAWQQVIQSEPIFRTVFKDDIFWDGKVAFFSWSEATLIDEHQFEEELQSICAPRITTPTTEFRVVTLAGKKSILVWHVHHALVDGYSARLLMRKVNMVLNGSKIREGFSFNDLVRGWRMYQTVFQQQATQFWAEYMKEMPNVKHSLLLPETEEHHENRNLLPGVINFKSPLQRIQDYTEANNVPLSSIYYAAWALTLAIYTGSDTVMFGVLFANRSIPIPAIRETVGPMMNTLPLLLSLDRTRPLSDFIQDTAKCVSAVGEYQWSIPDQHFPMTSALAIQYDYDIDTSSQNQPTSSYTRIQSSVPISIFLGPRDNVQITYHRNMYVHSDMERLGQMFIHAIDIMVRSETHLLDQYFRAALPPNLMEEILIKGNCSNICSRGQGNDTLESLFDACVRSHPNSPAIVKGKVSLTYSQLDDAATRVAACLIDTVVPGEVVCVHADRSMEWIVAIYAVFKAQAVYCPLDPAIPAQLRENYFQTAGSSLFLCTLDESKQEKPKSATFCYSVTELLRRPGGTFCTSALAARPKSSKKDAAYLCFTSGSSGHPKGVINTHEGVVAFQKDYESRLHMRPHLKLAQIMSPAFDGSIHEIFSTLSYSGTLLLPEASDVLANIQKADVALITPSVAKLLNPTDYPNLEAIYMVGEHVPQAVCDAWSAVMPAFNMYGPTESSCGSTRKTMVYGEKVTVGRPVPSMRLYILDQHRFPVPAGVIGELYTAGVQVSLGYVNRPEATAKSFMKDTICPETKQSMYRTQDLAYWNESGEICLLGRSDRQIKLRGFRVDLDDLEIRMVKCSTATSVAVARKDDILVAMVQPVTTKIASFNDAIKKVLPPQAMPRLIKAVERFPLTNNGKLNYKAIVAAFASEEPRMLTESSSPINYGRDMIMSIWKSVLNIDDRQVLDDSSSFLELGGDSIRQITLSTRLSAALQTQISPVDVMRNDTLGDQAHNFAPKLPQLANDRSYEGVKNPGVRIEATWRSLLSLNSTQDLHPESNFLELGGDSVLQQKLAAKLTVLGGKEITLFDVSKHPRLGDQARLISASKHHGQADVTEIGTHSWAARNALSPIEQEWVQKYHIQKGTSSFNVNYVCALDQDTDIGRLECAWNKALARHRILSSKFPNDHSRTYADSPPRVLVTSKFDIQQEINREFKLDEECPIRVFISPTTLVMVASHIVLDLTALNILLQDVQTFWNGKRPASLPRQYEKTTQWNRRITQNDLTFWDHLNDLPHHGENIRRLDYGGKSCVCKIPPATFRSMVQFTKKHAITLHQLSLAVVALVLRHGSTPNGKSTVLGAPYLNRGAEDFETVGLFLEPLIIHFKDRWFDKADLGHHTEISDSIWGPSYCKRVAAASQQSLSHSIPWNKLLEHLAIKPDHPNVPLIEAMVTFHDNRRRQLLPIDGVHPLYTWCEGAKFKIMFEFLAVNDDTGMLRVEYDDRIYSEGDCSRILSRVMAAIDGLTHGVGRDQIEKRMEEASSRPMGNGANFWGVRLVDL